MGRPEYLSMLPFEVKPSSIEGLGCFAIRDIPKGSLVAEYNGEIIDYDEAYRRQKRAPKGFTMLFDLGDDRVIDGDTPENNGTRYINHGCDSNLESRNAGKGRKKKVVLYATKDIKAGDELLYDYCIDVPDRRNLKYFECRCGAIRCYGTMSSDTILRDKAKDSWPKD